MERLAGKPWFIGAGFHRPHDPLVVAKKYVAQFPAGALTLHRDPADATPLFKQSLGGGAFEGAFKQFDDRDRMDFLTHYYAGVTQTDAQVGRLMEAMDRLKRWESTVVIFVGDHGYRLGERGWWNKNTLFDRSCRAPLLLIAPGVKPAALWARYRSCPRQQSPLTRKGLMRSAQLRFFRSALSEVTHQTTGSVSRLASKHRPSNRHPQAGRRHVFVSQSKSVGTLASVY